MTDAEDRVRFYFSFRSPYSWLALHRLEPALAPLRVSLEYVPVFPPPEFANDPLKFPDKANYYAEDLLRISRAYGLEFRLPEPFDCNWLRPHAAFFAAHDAGRGVAYAKALFEARFCCGKDLGQDSVMAACAAAAGLDPARVLAAQDDLACQERLMHGMIEGASDHRLFGVPMFVYRGERFWGNDRIDWLLRSIQQHRGLPVPDLTVTPFAPVWTIA
jgi:2-hydroxychromene-2-carboxylate isomerase